MPIMLDFEVCFVGLPQLVILAVPGEFTTMAGRRLRAAVYDRVRSCRPVKRFAPLSN